MALGFEFISIFGGVSNIAPSTCMSFGVTVLAKGVMSGITDSINELNALNNNVKQRDAKEMKKRFIDIIQVFSDAKELGFVPIFNYF